MVVKRELRSPIPWFGTGAVVVSNARLTLELMSTLLSYLALHDFCRVLGFRFKEVAFLVLMSLLGPKVSAFCASSFFFLSSLHWPADANDMGHFGVSYLEVLILFEQWSGQIVQREGHSPSCTCAPPNNYFFCHFFRRNCNSAGVPLHEQLGSCGGAFGWFPEAPLLHHSIFQSVSPLVSSQGW